MAVAQERMRILSMIEEGVITAEEGARLLAALEEPMPEQETARSQAPPPRWFRVRVTDLASGRTRVNVSIPMGLVDVGLKMGARLGPNVEGFDISEVTDAIRRGVQGKIFEVQNAEDGEQVEIYVE